MTKFSIIIPCKTDSYYLRECLAGIKKMSFNDYEIIVIPDKKFALPGAKILPLKAGPAEKRDLGAKKAKGDYLAFIDDDAFPAKDWLTNSLKYFNGRLVAVGGPQITPTTDSLLQQASGLVLSSWLVGGLRARYESVGKSFFVDDWPTVNFIVKRSVFLKLGGFDSHYYPGEDTKLCLDLVNNNFKIVYGPDCIVYHHRRYLFKSHIKQVSNYGLHRGFFVKRFPKTSLRPAYFAPSLIAMFLLSSLLLPLSPSLTTFYIPLLFIYLLLCIAGSINNDIKIIPLVFLGVILTHFFYGINFIKGLLTKELVR